MNKIHNFSCWGKKVNAISNQCRIVIFLSTIHLFLLIPPRVVANSEGYISNGYASSGELSPRLANMNDRQLRTLRITTGQSMPSMEPKVAKSSSKAVRIAAPKYKSTPKGRPGPVGRRSKVQVSCGGIVTRPSTAQAGSCARWTLDGNYSALGMRIR